jgi:flagellar biosynthesis protein FlhB
MSKPELAIGVRYLPAYPAPLILFKARGHQARTVLTLARKHGIPETSDQILAPLLFQLPEGSWIPEKHFAVLAQLLAAVYHGKES